MYRRSKGFAVSVLAAAVFAGTWLAVAGSTTPVERASDRTLAGRTIVQWHKLAVQRRIERDTARSKAGNAIRANRRLSRITVHRTDTLEAIRLAAITYQQSYSDMLRVASCETGGSFNRYSKNRSSSASGLYQFLYPSTWNSTPYASESVWSPYASALAAGYMWAHGRRSEWVCQ